MTMARVADSFDARFSCRSTDPALTSAIMCTAVISRASAFSLLLAIAGFGCGGCDDDEGLAASKASAVSRLDPVAADAGAPRYLSTAISRLEARSRTDGSGSAQPDDDERIGLRWEIEPPKLRVYRATQVAFRLQQAPKGHETASCSWNFGDGKTAEGCHVTHTFMAGMADEIVTLTLTDGDWEHRSKRTVPIERLEVVPGLLDGTDPLTSSRAIPKRPTSGDRTFRFAVIADTVASGGVPTSVRAAADALKSDVRPELVIHAGGIGGVDGVMSGLTAAGTKVAYALAPGDRAFSGALAAPGVQLLEGSAYPARYAFTYKGVFFMVISTDTTATGPAVSEQTIKWMRDQLAKARIYDARYVVSYLPVAKFSDTHVGTLDKGFRIYELFLRGRVTALITAAYRVYFKGTYGALDVVSVGGLSGPGGRLQGTDFQQSPSFVAVDMVKGVPKQTFAVEGPSFDRIFDESLLPKSVGGVYSLGR